MNGMAYRWEMTRRGMGGPSFAEFLRQLPMKVKRCREPHRKG